MATAYSVLQAASGEQFANACVSRISKMLDLKQQMEMQNTFHEAKNQLCMLFSLCKVREQQIREMQVLNRCIDADHVSMPRRQQDLPVMTWGQATVAQCKIAEKVQMEVDTPLVLKTDIEKRQREAILQGLQAMRIQAGANATCFDQLEELTDQAKQAMYSGLFGNRATGTLRNHLRRQKNGKMAD